MQKVDYPCNRKKHADLKQCIRKSVQRNIKIEFEMFSQLKIKCVNIKKRYNGTQDNIKVVRKNILHLAFKYY